MATVLELPPDSPGSEQVSAPRPKQDRRRHPLLAYVVKRVMAGLATLFVASVLIFASIQVLPGDVIAVVLGRNATPERAAQVRAELGLDTNVVQRYLDYLWSFLHGDFGQSTAALVQGSTVQVMDIVRPALSNSLILAIIVLVLFIPLSALLGAVSGLRAGRGVDHVVSSATLAVGALPEFLIGTVLIAIFFTQLGWFPPTSSVGPGESPLGDPVRLVLPVLTLLLVSMAFGARLLRASIIEVLCQEYVTIARLNGYSERRILFKYVLPNALVPSIQILAQQIQYLLGGIVVVESVFNYPGIGAELVRAIAVRDVQEIMVIATILSIAYILINIIADVVCVLLDPKVRTSL
jgi:peptide/nickel transport system permease protein